MDKTLKFELTSDDPAEIKKLLDQYLEVSARVNAKGGVR